jgi:hypothetical protein
MSSNKKLRQPSEATATPMESKKDFPEFQVPERHLSPEQEEQVERILARRKARRERAALKDKDLH